MAQRLDIGVGQELSELVAAVDRGSTAAINGNIHFWRPFSS